MSDIAFMTQADSRYLDANQRSIEWVLSRSHDEPWINTKFNPIELRDYSIEDALRGPGFVYGWIQGRALESLIQHARSLAVDDPLLSSSLLARCRVLYKALDDLHSEHDHACFCYDRNMTPVVTGSQFTGQAQRRSPRIRTYSDLFVVKGLIAASALLAPECLERHLSSLEIIIQAIDNDHFLMDESGHIDHEALQRQEKDFGPRMIALGAASLLHSLDLPHRDHFSKRFVQDVLEQHAHANSGLISNAPGGAVLNAGHAIELIGFHLETWGNALPDRVIATLSRLLAGTFNSAFDGSGLRLTIDLATRKSCSNLSPWWSLPETIRAASLAFELTQDPQFLQIWQAADKAFFENFWLGSPPLAVQMMRDGHAVDIVPATPDLDPGYHTGLSLLAARGVCQRRLLTSTTH
ncbi:hypothetical protein ACUNV4_23680 [Granulosicoccus sp. 3-233]|uniref:hypothetical protein n=1 Tax=Granulosicoccus sp. 3-233 TaxID=3417969 RepID=UPI003D353A8E